MAISLHVCLLVFAVGLFLGGLNFWALHLTVRKAVSSPRPGRYFLLSLFVRMALLLPPLKLLATHNPLYLPVGLIGFVLARKVVIYYTRPLKETVSVS